MFIFLVLVIGSVQWWKYFIPPKDPFSWVDIVWIVVFLSVSPFILKPAPPVTQQAGASIWSHDVGMNPKGLSLICVLASLAAFGPDFRDSYYLLIGIASVATAAVLLEHSGYGGEQHAGQKKDK